MGFIPAPLRPCQVSILVCPLTNHTQLTLAQGQLLLPAPLSASDSSSIGVLIPLPVAAKPVLLDDVGDVGGVLEACQLAFPGTKKKKFLMDDDSSDESGEDSASSDTAMTPVPQSSPPSPVTLSCTLCGTLDQAQALLDTSSIAASLSLHPCTQAPSEFVYLVAHLPSTATLSSEQLALTTVHFTLAYALAFNQVLVAPSLSAPLPDEPDTDWFDHRVYSIHTAREQGGKNSAEMLKNMKLRFASGSMMDIVPPTTRLGDVLQLIPGDVVPSSDELFRMRRVVGTHPHRDIELPLAQ